MGIGERIKKLRKSKGWTQNELAEKIGRSRQSILNWEKDKAIPDSDVLSIIASLFECSIDALLTDEQGPLKRKDVNVVSVPVLHPAVTICAGEGFRLEDVLIDAVDMQEVPLDETTGRLGELSPFLVKVSGDSMVGIPDGAEMFCNPNEEIRTGDYAICCIDGKWMVRGIIWRRDGSLELRPTNGEYHPIIVAREDLNSGWAKILAKVMWVRQGLPKFI